jgi:hypothetical protein
MQASPLALSFAACQFKDATWMRRRKPRRDGRTFRPERLGGALRAELIQNIKQLMDEQFVHESDRSWQDPSPFHWMAGSGSPHDFDIMRSCLPP